MKIINVMNMKQSKEEKFEIPIVDETLLTTRCIYCGKGSTEKNPMLFKINAPGEYWQHWNFENIGCDENTENIYPT